MGESPRSRRALACPSLDFRAHLRLRLSPNHIYILHSDVDVFFLRDPRPFLVETCRNRACYGAGEFPKIYADKWGATATAGFSLQEAGHSRTLALARRVAVLTAEIGDDQIATNKALDEVGTSVTLLDAVSFPVGGCDRWLDVVARRQKQVVLHPNCVDKAGTAKSAWLKRRQAWLLRDDWKTSNQLINDSAIELRRFSGDDDEKKQLLGCEKDAENDFVLSVVDDSSKTFFVLDSGNDVLDYQLTTPSLLFLRNDTSAPRRRALLATQRASEGHDLGCAFETTATACRHFLFGGLDAPAVPVYSKVGTTIRSLDDDDRRLPAITFDCRRDNNIKCFETVSDILQADREEDISISEARAQKAAHVSEVAICESGRLLVARLTVFYATQIRLKTTFRSATIVPLDGGSPETRDVVDGLLRVDVRAAPATYRLYFSLRNHRREEARRTMEEENSFLKTKAPLLRVAAVEFLEAWLEPRAPRMDGDGIACLVPPAFGRFFPRCQQGGTAPFDVVVAAYDTHKDPRNLVLQARQASSSLVWAVIGESVDGMRKKLAASGFCIVDIAAGVPVSVEGEDDYAAVVAWAMPGCAQETEASLVVEDNTDASAFEAIYASLTATLGDSGDRAAALFGVGVLRHVTDPISAARAYERALALDPLHSAALGNLAALRYDGDQIPEALTLLERAVRANATQASLERNLFRVLDRQNRARALGLVDRIVYALASENQFKQQTKVRLVQQEVADEMSLHSTSEVVIVEVATNRQAYLAALRRENGNLLVLSEGWEDPEIAAATRRELERRGHRVVVEEGDVKQDCMTNFAVGDEAYAQKDLERAALAYRRIAGSCHHRTLAAKTTAEDALVAAASSRGTRSRRSEVAARAYYRLGVLAQEVLDLEQAESHYATAATLDPELASAWNNLGVVCFTGDRLELAARCFERGDSPENSFLVNQLLRAQATLLPPREARTKVHVLAGLYRGAASEARFAELVEAQRRNAALQAVAAVHSFAEDIDPLTVFSDYDDKSKLVVAANASGPSGRPRQSDYADYFRYANERLRGEVVVVAHTDIYFDEAIGCLGAALRQTTSTTTKVVFAVTRRPDPSCVAESGGGHGDFLFPENLCAPPAGWPKVIHGYDAFAFVAPVPESVVLALEGLRQNVLGADLRVVDAFNEAGYDVWNPCAQVPAYHLHCTRERSYSFTETTRPLDTFVPVAKLAASRRFNDICEAGHGVASLRPLLVASFPRSGSTMLRRWLEVATQKKTGSTHFDPALLAAGFRGEGHCRGVVTVKTHHPAIKDFSPQDCRDLLQNRNAALLLRDPFDSIRSYFEYQNNTTPHFDTKWPDFALTEATRWRSFVDFWQRDSTVLRYEDLVGGEAHRTFASLLDRLFPDQAEGGNNKKKQRALASFDDMLSRIRHGPRRRGTREAHYPPSLKAAVFEALGGPEFLAPFGYYYGEAASKEQ